ncbi:MAG TPA: dihydromethanopterin reductase, partial [Burkholderiaceae bacterium]|nr:dihydromethanopterin reductase [Burkholderiaceae bacterium]
MSAATPCTADFTSCTSPCPTPARTDLPGEPELTGAELAGTAARSRFAWCLTGSGHGLTEALALAERLPDTDLFLSAAAEEVLGIYGIALEGLRQRFRLVRDKTASA